MLLDDAHNIYGQVERGTADEHRLWAAIFVYVMLISPREVRYMQWPGQAPGFELAEFLL
jgi:hypothetical protein